MRELFASTAMLALVIATPALAQTAPTDAPATARSDNNDSSGDIIITARKREESIRDVPGTISAVTADQLDSKGAIAGTGDLLNTVPGVRFNDLASENLAEVSIRGSGTARATGADSGVGLFVNGAYVGSSTLGGRNFKTIDYMDLERVEVLEGPQGALYGRNSEFGVTNIVLAKPQFRNAAYIKDQYSFGLNQNKLDAMVNAKLSEKVAFRVSFEDYAQARGFYYNPNKDKYYDNSNGWAGRAQLRYRSGRLDVNLLVDGQDLSLPSFVNSYVVQPGTIAALPLGFVQSRFTLPHDGEDGLQQKVVRSILSVNYDFGGVQLQSTTMATRWRSSQQYGAAIDYATLVDLRRQNELGIYPFTQVHTNVVDRTLYQDFHLTGKTGGLTWIAGAEGLYQNDRYELAINSSPCAFTTVAQSICGGTPTAKICLKPLPTSLACPATYPLVFGTDSFTKQRIYSAAAYASLQYDIGKLSLVGEGRFSHDYKTATQFIYALYTTTYTRAPTTFVFKKDQPAWTFTASYKPISGTLLYAKVGTGYRAGGVNNGSFNAAAPNPFVFTYQNETTVGYEVGVKSSVTRNVFARVSAYTSRTNDAITSINDGCTLTNACLSGGQQFNVNGGTIHARGLEAAIDSRFKVAGGNLSISLNAATQRAYFYSIPTGITGLPTVGSKVAQIPDWTMSAVVEYRHKLAEGLVGFFNVSYSGQRGGVQDTVTAATPPIYMDNFDVFGARAGFNMDNLQVALSVRNLTDTQIQVLKFTSGNFPLSVRYNKPRTFALTVSYRW